MFAWRNRRTCLSLALVLVLCLLVASCTRQQPSGSDSTGGGSQGGASGQPVMGGTLRLALAANPTPYPITMPGTLYSILVCKTMYNTLVKYDRNDLHPIPDLAESWDISPDGKTYTFKLRRDVKWHDGQPFTADDVKFTLDAILNENVNAQFRAYLRGVKSVEVVDKYTVKIVRDAPSASFLTALGYNIYIVPKHLLEGQDLNNPVDFIRNPVGTGPFKFKEFQAGSHLIVEANQDYFEGRPYLDSLVFKVIPNLNTQIAQLRTGELDFAEVTPDTAQGLKGASNVVVQQVNQVNYYYIAPRNDHPLFSDKRVRQAMAYAIEKQALIDNVLLGQGTPAVGPISPILGQYFNSNLKPYPYDMEKAKALLAEAGWKPGPNGILERDGKPFKFSLVTDKGNPPREKIAVIAQQQWKQLGMDVTIDAGEYNVTRERMQKGDYEAIVRFFVTAPDPDVTDNYHSSSKENRWRYSSAEADRLMDEGRAELNPAKRAEIYHRLQEVLYEDQPVIFLYYPYELQARNAKIRNMPSIGMRDAFLYLHRVWLER